MFGWLRKYGNESVADWRHLLRKTVEAVPDFDSDGSILLMDDFKGGRGVLDVFNNDVGRFLCSFHLEQNITAALGIKAAALPIKALHVKTPEELKAIKLQYPSKTRRYMAKRPDEEQYRCMRPELGHRSTSQGAESANMVNKPFRTSTFGDVNGLANLAFKRFQQRKKEVEDHTGVLPPKIMKAHAQQAQYAALVPASDVQFINDDQAIVESNVDANKNYIVDLGAVRNNDRAGMCDGLCNVQSIGVCRHVLAMTRAKGASVDTFMPKNQTTAGWKAAYDACAVLRPPSSAEIKKFEHLRNDNLCLPPVIKTRTGAPRKHKRDKSAVETLKEKIKKKQRKKK